MTGETTGPGPKRDEQALVAWLGEPPQGGELALLQAVAAGEIAGPDAGAGARAAAPEADELATWGPERTVRAVVVRRLLLDKDSPADPSGVWLRNLRITGRFELEGCDCPLALSLERCHLAAPEPIDLDYATIPALLMTGCVVAGLSGSCLEVKKSADFSRTRFAGSVCLPNASITDNLDFTGAHVAEGGPDQTGAGRVDLDAVTVGGRVRLNNGFTALSVNLRAAQLTANLNCRNGRLTGSTAALSIEQATIKGEVMLEGLAAANGHLRMLNADIEGNLTCDGVQLGETDGISLAGAGLKVGGAARFRGDFRAKGTVRLRRATVAGNLNFRRSQLQGPAYSLELWRAKIGGDLLFDPAEAEPPDPDVEHGPCICSGAIQLDEAGIAGNLRAGSATCVGSVDGRCLSGEGLTVGGSVFLGRFTGSGTVWLRGANIGLDLRCRGCVLTGASVAINAERLRVGGDALLDMFGNEPGLSTEGGVSLFGARIAGHLDCGGATIGADDDTGVSLHADLISVGARLQLSGGFTAAGTVLLRQATIGAQFDCSGAILNGPDCALAADQTTVAGDLILGAVDGDAPATLVAAGPLSLDRIKVGGDLDGRGIVIAGSNDRGNALYADGATIGRNARLSDGLVVDGGIWLRGAAITGDFDGRSARIRGRTRGLNLEQSRIGGDAHLDGSFVLQRGEAPGTPGRRAPLALNGVRITGSLTAAGLRVIGSDAERRALDVDGGSIGAGARLGSGLRARGVVWLRGATIGTDLDCDGARVQALVVDRAKIGGDVRLTGSLTVTDEIALREAQVAGTLHWAPTSQPTSVVDLEGCTAHTLKDDWRGRRAQSNGNWPAPGRLRLDGFTYTTIDGGDGDGAVRRLGWVRSQYPDAAFTSQPYEQLTNVYQSAGQDSDARLMAINRRRDRRTHGDLRDLRRAMSWLLDVSIAYGYATWRALLYLAVVFLVVLGFSIYAGEHPGTMVPAGSTAGITPAPTTATCTSDYPCYSAFGYTIDTVVPLVNVHQASNWQPNADAPAGWLFVFISWAGTVLGYALATLAVAGYTGLVRSGDGF